MRGEVKLKVFYNNMSITKNTYNKIVFYFFGESFEPGTPLNTAMIYVNCTYFL